MWVYTSKRVIRIGKLGIAGDFLSVSLYLFY
jgi:hypothetical protein